MKMCIFFLIEIFPSSNHQYCHGFEHCRAARVIILVAHSFLATPFLSASVRLLSRCVFLFISSLVRNSILCGMMHFINKNLI